MDRDRVSPRSPSALAGSLCLAVALAVSTAAFAQNTPYLPNASQYGRHDDNGTLRYCIDPRDPEWKIAAEIADQVAGALLLTPARKQITDKIVTAGWTTLYQHLLADCDVYFGFKLIPGAYPGWLALSRAYYDASYVVAVTDPNWTSLGDIPPDRPIGTAIGTSADFGLIKYLQTMPANKKWRRFPMGNNEAALSALEKGTVGAALVWGPAVWALQQDESVHANVRLIGTAPLPTTTLGMGAAMLANESFLRSSLDKAIASLAADGTIQSIIDKYRFPATVSP